MWAPLFLQSVEGALGVCVRRGINRFPPPGLVRLLPPQALAYKKLMAAGELEVERGGSSPRSSVLALK